LFRGEGQAYLEPAPQDITALDLSEPAQRVYALLRAEGAVFFADIQAALELETAALEAALVELVMAGLATNDSLETMRQVVEPGGVMAGPPRERQPWSALETQLAERRQGQALPGGLRRPGRAAYQVARRRVRERVVAGSSEAGRLGRWTLVHRLGVLGKAISPAARAGQQTRQLLARYGIVTRESLAGEIGSWDWSLIYPELQRLEMRGEVRRGYFVQGLPGLQFALPEAVERLRQARDEAAWPEVEAVLVLLNAGDPANCYGPAMPDIPLRAESGLPLTFARLPSTWLVQQRGLPILLAEDTGGSLTTTQGASEGLVQQALQLLFDHLGRFERRIRVEQWNGAPVLQSPGRSLLEAVGCYRDYPGMTYHS
jgi:ATP-dependent Lhr-like helicase